MENNEKKENPFVKGLIYFLNYIRLTIYDFINSFRYNNMKLACLLVAIPGLIIGFLLVYHIPTINSMAFTYYIGTFKYTNAETAASCAEAVKAYYLEHMDSKDLMQEINALIETFKYKDSVLVQHGVPNYEYPNFPGMPIDLSGLSIFILMLVGILNVFFALSMSSKKNLGSVVGATVLTVLLVGLTVVYIYCIEYFKKITNVGEELTILKMNYINVDTAKGVEVQTVLDTFEVKVPYKVTVDPKVMENFNSNYLISSISICVLDGLSALGCVFGFINYDRTYEKVDR